MISPEQTLDHAHEQQQRYLQRVADFFAQVCAWLPDELETVEIKRTIEDETGQYEVSGIAIVRKEVAEPDDAVADLLPEGSSVLLAEGLIELSGAFGTESILYMVKDSLIICDAAGKERPMFKGLEQDGWYWLENKNPITALALNADLFMELLAMVSDYEFA